MKMPPLPLSLPLEGGGKGGGDFHPYVVPAPGMGVIQDGGFKMTSGSGYSVFMAMMQEGDITAFRR